MIFTRQGKRLPGATCFQQIENSLKEMSNPTDKFQMGVTCCTEKDVELKENRGHICSCPSKYYDDLSEP